MADGSQPGTAALAAALARIVRQHVPGASGIAGLAPLTGGASQECWLFAAVTPAGGERLVLRRAPPGAHRSPLAAGLLIEAAVIDRVRPAGVPVPGIVHVLTPADGLGEGFVMRHVEGETIPRRILRDDRFAAARTGMAARCGAILAGIHRTEAAGLALRRATAAVQIETIERIYRDLGQHRPVFNLALRWLRARLPESPARLRLVHGDFRTGNLIVGEEGVRAVLDWELAHLGDPAEDLGWFCVNSWRFGAIERPAGGFGTIEELLSGYRAAGGGAVDPARLHFWLVLGTLSWGVVCAGAADAFTSGRDPGVARAMIGRRASECELDLLHEMRAAA